MSSGPTRQHPPTSRAPAVTQADTSSAWKADRPSHSRVAAFHDWPGVGVDDGGAEGRTCGGHGVARVDRGRAVDPDGDHLRHVRGHRERLPQVLALARTAVGRGQRQPGRHAACRRARPAPPRPRRGTGSSRSPARRRPRRPSRRARRDAGGGRRAGRRRRGRSRRGTPSRRPAPRRTARPTPPPSRRERPRRERPPRATTLRRSSCSTSSRSTPVAPKPSKETW